MSGVAESDTATGPDDELALSLSVLEHVLIPALAYLPAEFFLSDLIAVVVIEGNALCVNACVVVERICGISVLCDSLKIRERCGNRDSHCADDDRREQDCRKLFHDFFSLKFYYSGHCRLIMFLPELISFCP